MDSSIKEKANPVVWQGPVDGSVENSVDIESDVNLKESTPYDRAAMWRMGKTQELRRDFSTISMFGFTMILVASWEVVLENSTTALTDGGTAGYIWMFLICWLVMIFVYLSMSEMASMAPTSGGQYHWVSEFASKKYQRSMSYFVGWMSILGWQAFTASAPYVTGTIIQGLIILKNPDYVPQPYHGTCLSIAIAMLGLCFNVFLARKLPLLEGILVVIHILGFFAVIVTFWVLAPTAEPRVVFSTYNDAGSWGNLGASTMIGISSSLSALLGADAAVHMSEEVKDAGRSIPRAILTAAFLNGAAGFVMTITYCFCISAMDIDAVLGTSTGYPFIQVFYNITGSFGGTMALSVFPILFGFAGTVTTFATSSRQLFAFARDDALPFSPFFARVHGHGLDIPLNALIATFTISCLLSLINLGSAVALNAIVSLATSALLTGYSGCLGCMIWRRWTGAPVPAAEFSLGKYGLSINIFSFVMVNAFMVLSFFPVYNNPTIEEMNWSIMIYGMVAVFSLGYYFAYARKKYVGPVTLVRKLE